MTDTGLLFVWGEVGPDASADEFNDWYDNEHGPLRLTVPGFKNAIRYKATDGQTPSWVALYDLDHPSVPSSEPYKALAGKASDREKALIPRLAVLNRAVYEKIFEQTKPGLSANAFPANYVLIVQVAVPSLSEDAFNKWYNEEHIPDIASHVPGWNRARRYKLVGQPVELTGKQDPSIKEGYNYLAIHDFDRADYATSPALVAAIHTPAAGKILQSVNGVDMRHFTIHKHIQKHE
ncbi:hypothetical protein GALMADRAFT_54032 [Galerina marginata CBS 339.88]|uniref:EthD domain-containing protein n=1 Tax=Galerina marginata (strain CBS 339.88) TaxID=685588 RepID=A0A067TU23_GALM3|nr:hypothetical protein GALMADRAFT_54032 [Galerina marginata CBS 339.88]